MALASTSSARLPAKAAEIYKEESENFSKKQTPARLKVKTFGSVCTWGSRFVQSVVRLCRTITLSCRVS